MTNTQNLNQAEKLIHEWLEANQGGKVSELVWNEAIKAELALAYAQAFIHANL